MEKKIDLIKLFTVIDMLLDVIQNDCIGLSEEGLKKAAEAHNIFQEATDSKETVK